MERRSIFEEDVNKIWTQLAFTIRVVAKATLRVTSKKFHHQKEVWWWNDKVQERVKAKKDCFSKLVYCQD